MKNAFPARLPAALFRLLAAAIVAAASRPRFAHPWLMPEKKTGHEEPGKRTL